MADVTPNYSLEIQCVELERAQLELNIQSQKYRIAQLLDESTRIGANIEATQIALATLDEKINSLKGQ
jgi:predicted  nucleic acid-binding Zn-ribbon protein